MMLAIKMTPFEAYKKFLALKNHFTGSYDYFKYQGKVSASSDSFERRKDKYHFYKLSKHKDPERYLISNFVNRDLQWIGELFNDESESTYIQYIKKIESLTYNFTNDLENLLTSFDENVIVKEGQHPYLLKLYLRKQVSIETLVILNDVFNFFPYWNKKIADTIIWPSVYKKCQKYKPFLQYDIFKCKKILREKFE